MALGEPIAHYATPTQSNIGRPANTLPFTYAPHEPGQHLYHRVHSVAGSGFIKAVTSDKKGSPMSGVRGPKSRGQ